MHGDTDAISRVADLAGIPKEQRPQFARMARLALREAHRGYGIRRGIPRQGEIIKILNRLRKASPVTAVSLLQREHKASQAAFVLLEAAFSPKSLKDWFNACSRERDRAIDQAISWAERDFRSGGRTPGTTGRSDFDLFVFWLLHAAKAAGGDFGAISQFGKDERRGDL